MSEQREFQRPFGDNSTITVNNKMVDLTDFPPYKLKVAILAFERMEEWTGSRMPNSFQVARGYMDEHVPNWRYLDLPRPCRENA